MATATVFYATMIYFDGRFEVAALRYRDRSISMYKNNDTMPVLHISMSIFNDGDITAEKIEAEMTVIDPVRGKSTFSHEAEIHSLNDTDDNATAPLAERHSREITFQFILSNSEIERIRIGDRYGIDPWAVIKIDSPEQITTTWIYLRLRDHERIDLTGITDAGKAMTIALEKERNRVLEDNS